MGNRSVIKAGDVQRMSTGTGLTHSEHNLRPLQNAPFCPISVSSSNYNPQNTQCIPVVNPPMFGGGFAFLELEQN
jgi:hypothetical protein